MKKDCCKDERNLYRDTQEEAGHAELVVMRCRVCNCRHFELSIPTFTIDAKLHPVG